MKKIKKENLKEWFFNLQEEGKAESYDGTLKFEVIGMGIFLFVWTYFHYCYAEGRMSEDTMLEAIKITH